MNKSLMVASLVLNVIMLTALILIGSSVFSEKPPVVREVQRWNQDAAIPTDINIAMLGNSLTAYADWDELLGRKDVQNIGVADFTTEQLSWLLDRWVIASKPVICFINGGQEDIILGIPAERVAENYSRIIDKLQQHNIKAVIQSTLLSWNDPERNHQIERINVLLKSICDEKNIDYININTVLSGNNGLKPQLTTDGMHLNHKGYELWAIMLKDYLLLHNPQKK